MAALSFLTARLRRWRKSHALMQRADLAIAGLPPDVGPLPVATPSFLLMQDSASAQYWPPALLEQLLAVGPVLALAAEAAQLDELWPSPPLRQAYASGQLRLAVLPHARQTWLRQDGLERWSQELHRAGLDAGASLCLLDARAMLAGASLAQLQRLGGQLRHWAAQRAGHSVFMLPLARSAPPGLPLPGEAIAAAARSGLLGMAHAASLSASAEAAGDAAWVLTLHQWDGPQGALLHMRYDLQPPGQGQGQHLTYAGSYAHGEIPVLVHAPDLHTVYTTAACVAGVAQLPATWQVLPDWQAVEAAAQSAQGATLLLDAGPAQQLDALCTWVHRVRSQCPPHLKIIVRETSAKLRAHSEQALLHLGVTAVAYRELGFARLLRLIDNSRAVLYVPAQDIHLPQVLQAFTPTALRGYQAPVVFAATVRQMLERSRRTDLTHSLVQLQLLPQIAHLDALQACTSLRDGDLLTTDGQGLLVFLFACQPVDVSQALRNMFTLPLEHLFAAQVTDGTAPGIHAMLEHFSRQATSLPDYTAMLQSTASAPVATVAHPQPVDATAAGALQPSSTSSTSPTLPALPMPAPASTQLQPQAMRPQPIGQRVPIAPEAL